MTQTYKLAYRNHNRPFAGEVAIGIDLTKQSAREAAEEWLEKHPSIDSPVDWSIWTLATDPQREYLKAAGTYRRIVMQIPVRGESYDDGIAFANDIAKLKHADAPWWHGFCDRMQQFANDDAELVYNKAGNGDGKLGMDAIDDAVFGNVEKQDES